MRFSFFVILFSIIVGTTLYAGKNTGGVLASDLPSA